MKLHILSYANTKIPIGYTNFENSMKKYKIPYKIIGDGDKWEGFHTKMISCFNEIQKYKDEDIVCIVDCFDVMANHNMSNKIISRFLKYNKPIVFGAENRVFFSEKAHNYFKLHKWWKTNDKKYNRNVNNCSLNGGTVIGYVKNIKEVLDFALRNKFTDDQLAYHYYTEKYPEIIDLDLSSSLFGNYTGYNMFRFISFNDYFIDKESCYQPFFLHIPGAKVDFYYRMNRVGNIILQKTYLREKFLKTVASYIKIDKKYIISVIATIVIFTVYIFYLR
jgi:hypothetical protein